MEQTETTVIQRTYLYLENYNEMQRYISEAVSEVSQVSGDNIYNMSAEKAFLKSIRECKAETIILFEHINKSLEALRRETKAAGEEYKYQAFHMRYIEGKTYDNIAKAIGCGKNSPKKWCKVMVERFSIKLFGVKAIEK